MLSHFPLRWNKSLIFVRRISLGGSLQAEKKTKLSGKPPPIELSSVKAHKIEVGASDSSSKSSIDPITIVGGLFVLGLVYVLIIKIIYPTVVRPENSVRKRALTTEAYVRTQDLIREYRDETNNEQLSRQLHLERQKQNSPDVLERQIPDQNWRKATKLVNPTENFAEEKARFEAEPEDSRTLEEIKASVAALQEQRKNH